MKRQVALSAIGRDQPGIVASLSRVLYEQGCNLEESSMTRLKGEFAILLLVTLPEGGSREPFEAAVQETARRTGLAVLIRELSAEEMAQEDDSATQPYTLIVYGADRPGIVFRVTETAARHGINITDLRTRVTGGGGNPILYSLIMEVEIPGDAAADAFRQDLAQLRGELRVETTLERVEAEEL
jgi:glycine cleavage system transcriptional repressor